jgi:hypothetical protein
MRLTAGKVLLDQSMLARESGSPSKWVTPYLGVVDLSPARVGRSLRHRVGVRSANCHGWRSSAPAAGRHVMSIYARYLTCRRHAGMISGGWSEAPEGWEAPGSDHAPACPALAPAAAGKLNAKLKSDFRCYPNNGHAATASPVRFV